MERQADLGRRHLAVYGSLTLLGLVVLASALAAAGLLVRYFREVDYPGAARTSDHTLYSLYPSLTLRRSASYRTGDLFTRVYNYYSSGFELGPEAHAQSGCILMARSEDVFLVLESEMSVMLCDTSTGRLVFVMRSLALSWR